MRIFDFFKKKTVPAAKKRMKTNPLDMYTNSIPPNIRNLLFISDKRTVWNKKQYTHNGMSISFEMSSDFEPSEILTTLPVRKGNTESLGYFPSYYEMTPEQRFAYLTFLTDITKPVDIGYVFVFYYGLERKIYLNKNLDEAADTIIHLQKYHKNKSFLAYSNDALIYAAMKKKDPDMLFQLNLDSLRPELLFLVKGSFIGEFNANDLIALSKAVGFTNNRYIKANYDLFEKNLSNILKDRFNQGVYKLDSSIDIDTQEKLKIVMANISIPEREFQFPNRLLNFQIHSDIYMLLKEAHEQTKVELATIRKKNPAPKSFSTKQVKKEAEIIYAPNDGLSLKERILLSKEPQNNGFEEEIKGIDFYKQGKYEKAEKWLLRSVKGNFNAPGLYDRLGILYRKQKRFADEVEILKIGIKNVGINPRLSERLAKAIELNEKQKFKSRQK